MTDPLLDDFQRSRTRQRIKSIVVTLGLVATLVMAIPIIMMIVFKGFASLGGGYVLFALPLAVCFLIAHVSGFARHRGERAQAMRAKARRR